MQYSWPKRGGAADGYKHTESVGGMCKKKKKKEEEKKKEKKIEEGEESERDLLTIFIWHQLQSSVNYGALFGLH